MNVRSRLGDAAGLPQWGRPAVAVLATLAAGAARPAAAQAAESAVPTAQQVSYGGAWLPFVDPADLPPVEQRPVVCLVDSGVSVTGDLPADRPEGPIVSRLSAVDGEDAQPGTAPENQHGTDMGLIIGAQRDGQGTVGAVPWARVVSVKAMSRDARGFVAGDYVYGAHECRTEVVDKQIPVAAVNFSFGCDCSPSQQESDLLELEIKRLRLSGALVLASAGNVVSAPVGYPASQRGVIAIAAGDAGGRRCDYGSYGSQALIGPACAIDTAEGGQPVRTTGGGSSSASAFTSALVAAVKTFRRDASSQDLEVWMRVGSRLVDGRAVVDAEGMFRAAGLDAIVDRAKARQQLMMPPVTTPAPPAPPVVRSPADGVVVPPSTSVHVAAKLTWSHKRLTVVVLTRRRADAVVKIRLERKKGKGYRTLRTVYSDSARSVLRAPRRPDRVHVWFRYGDDSLSTPAVLRLTRKRVYR